MKRNLIKKAAVCMAAVMCMGSFSQAGLGGVSVYADTDEISEDVIGQYATQGYENPEYGFKIQLPDNFVLEPRQTLVQFNDQDTVEQSNSDSAYSYVRTQAALGSPVQVFTAYTDTTTSSLAVQLQTPGIGNDHWDKESVVAESTAKTYEDSLKEVLGEDVEITDFETSVDSAEFAGKEHYMGMYKCLVNGTPYYGTEIYLVSDDDQYLLTVGMSSLDPDELTGMFDYFTTM